MAIKFIEKVHGSKRSAKRGVVNATVIKRGTNAAGEQQFSLRLAFCNENMRKITKTGYVAVGIDDEMQRMYFKESDSRSGFKVVNSGTIAEIRLTLADAGGYSAFRGDMQIVYDSEAEMRYIQGGRKHA